MQRGNVYPARTDPALHFTEALAQNAAATLDLRLDEGLAAGRHCRSILRHLTIVSVQQLAWELALFGRRNFEAAALADFQFLASWRFTAAEGLQFGSSPYIYQAPNIDLPYADYDFEDTTLPADDRGGYLHLMLVNRSPTAKEAGAAGAVQITCYLEPTYG